MPFTKGQSDDQSDLRDLAFGWGKIVSRRAYGEQGPALDADFDSIESLVVENDLSRRVQGTSEGNPRHQFESFGDHQACPQCEQASRCGEAAQGDSDPRRHRTLRGARLSLPGLTSGFFSLAPSLRLDSHNLSLRSWARSSAQEP